MSKSTLGYKLDLATQTLTITSAFAEAANNPENKEYKLIQQFKHDFPKLKIERKTHASPKKPNKYKKLTYERMEKFMCALPNSGEKYMEEYRNIRAVALLCDSPYSIVRRWFEAQFPYYKTNPLFYVDNDVKVIKFADILDTSANDDPADEEAA